MKELIKRTIIDVLVLLLVASYLFCVSMAFSWYQFKKAIDMNMALQQQRQQEMQKNFQLPKQPTPKVEENKNVQKK